MGSQEEKDKKDKQKGWVTTLSVHVILLVLFAFFGMHYQDPPKEYAIVMEFGGAPESSPSPAKQEDEKEDKETDKSKDPGGKTSAQEENGSLANQDKVEAASREDSEVNEFLKSFKEGDLEENYFTTKTSTEIPLTSDKDGIGDIGKIGYGDGKALNSKGRLKSLGNLETLGETGYMELTFVYNREVKKFESIVPGSTSFSGQKERDAFEKAKKALEATKFEFALDDPLKVKGTFIARWKN